MEAGTVSISDSSQQVVLFISRKDPRKLYLLKELFIFDLVISGLMLEEKIGRGKGEVLIWLTDEPTLVVQLN